MSNVTKKICALSLMIMLATSSLFAQKVFKFKTTDKKSAKVTIPGKLVSTLVNTNQTKQEYYVDFDLKGKQVIISQVLYGEKDYLGNGTYFCKFEEFDKRFLENTQLQESTTGLKFYSYSLSAKGKFPLKSCNSFTGKETNSEEGNVAIRFADEKTAKEFLEKLKKNVGM